MIHTTHINIGDKIRCISLHDKVTDKYMQAIHIGGVYTVRHCLILNNNRVWYTILTDEGGEVAYDSRLFSTLSLIRKAKLAKLNKLMYEGR